MEKNELENANMKKRHKILTVAGGLILITGIILGFVLTSVMVWGDLEASLFTSGMRADRNLSTLKCPIVITTSETGKITATLKNPTEKTLERYLIANVSEGYASLVREIRTKLPIPPAEKRKVEWKIYPEDAAFDDRVILFRVYINPRHPHPSLGANCGVVRVDLQGITGNQIVASTAFLAFSSIGFGAVLIELGHRSSQKRSRNVINSGYVLAGIILAAGILSYFGMWILGIGLLAIAVLLLGIIVTRRLSK
jgi:hypothetical protein